MLDEHAIRRVLEGGGGAAGAAARLLLHIPGKLYGEAMRLRRALYAKNILASAAAPVPVISVGNLTAGGTGKTPLVVLLADHFLARGKRPAILLRGYRAGSDGAGSDEAALYRRLCPEALLRVGPNRADSARDAAAAGADILLMDDGFQHRRLRRDLDIVLIDALSPWGGGNTIPGGLLREPPAALAAAHVLVITRSDQVAASALAALASRLGTIAPGAALFTARHEPARLRSAGGGELPLETLQGKEVVLLSGIARPEAFAKTLRALGAGIGASFTENDHRHFSNSFVEKALACAQARGALLVTTEKDEGKLPALSPDTAARVWILGVRQAIDDADRFFGLVDGAAGGRLEITSCILRECGHNGFSG